MSTAKPADAVAGGIARHSRDRRGARSAFDEPNGVGASATIVLAAAPEASTDLTAAETDRLVELERAVDRGLQTFVEVGQALAEICERKLYRASHDTFERTAASGGGSLASGRGSSSTPRR